MRHITAAVLGFALAFSVAYSRRVAAQPSPQPEKLVVICPERMSPSGKARLAKTHGQGAFRVNQKYATVARLAEGRCTGTDGGAVSCVPFGVAALQDGRITIPSHHQPSKVDDETGDADGQDTSYQLVRDSCQVMRCEDFTEGNPGFCNRPFAVMQVAPRCVTPNCWRSDGGWDESLTPDCKLRQALPDGGSELFGMGCNTFPASQAVGTQCVPTNCEVVSGEPGAWL